MEKFNAIKILEEELADKDLFDRNLSKEHYMKSVYSFIDNYVEPLLKRRMNELNLKAPQELIDDITQDISNDTNISDENKKNMLKPETMDLYYNDMILKYLLMETPHIVNELGLIDKEDYLEIKKIEDDISNFLDENEVGFLGKDKKTKEKVANKLCISLIGMLKDSLDEDTKKE